jgi:hypothetical protein
MSGSTAPNDHDDRTTRLRLHEIITNISIAMITT